MATRHPFGGGIADWVHLENDADVPVLQGGATMTFWNAREGGSQYLDLASDAAGSTPITSVLTSDGSDGYRIGQIPIFYGPPDVTYMWASADGGERVAVGSIDSADLAGAVAAQFASHVSQVNAHQVSFSTLVDTDIPSSIPAGAVPVWDADLARWVVSVETGLNPAAFVNVAGGSTIQIPNGNTTTQALRMRVPAGSRGSAPDTLAVQWNSGTDGAPTWITTTTLDPYGQLRVQAAADAQVASRVTRRSSTATADMQQWCNETGTPLAWVTAKGLLRAPNVGRTVTWTAAGVVSNGTGRFLYTNLTGADQLLKALIFRLDTAATSGTVVLDPFLNGATLYPTGKPSLASGATSTGIISASFTITAGSTLRVDVSGTYSGAQNLTGQIELS